MRPHHFSSARWWHGISRHAATLLLAGLSSFALRPAIAAQKLPAAQPYADLGFASFIAEAAQRFRIPEEWIRTVQRAESRHVHDVSSAGAMGLMQIMPDTWTELRARYGLGSDPFDPHDNIIAGTAYLREMLDRYGNVSALLAAYNAGPTRYDDYIATGRPLPTETRDYVAKLAPILGGQPLPERMIVAPSQSVDWRDAPLFVQLAGGGSPVGSAIPDGQSAATPAPMSVGHNAAANTSKDALFIGVSGKGLAP